MRTYKYRYVYKTTNTINGKIYVGQHKDNVMSNKYKGSGTYLKRAFRKYGKHNFIKEIICHCEDDRQLGEMETYWIKELNATHPDIGYNLLSGAYNLKERKEPGVRNCKFTKEELSEKGIIGVIKNGQAKPLICTNTGVIYRTIAEASRLTNIQYKRLQRHLNRPDLKHTLTKAKLVFKFLEGEQLKDFYKQYPLHSYVTK